MLLPGIKEVTENATGPATRVAMCTVALGGTESPALEAPFLDGLQQTTPCSSDCTLTAQPLLS